MSEFVKVVLETNDCYECGETSRFTEANEYHGRRPFYPWEYPLEVPVEWLERWKAALAAYNEAQEELAKIIRAYIAGQNYIETPETVIAQGGVEVPIADVE